MGTPGLRWRELETDELSQWSGSASHRQRWIGLKDRCLKSGTAPAPDPTLWHEGDIWIPPNAAGRRKDSTGDWPPTLALPLIARLLERLAQLRQGAIAPHPAQPRLDVQQRCGQPPLLLIAVAPAVDFPGPLLDQAEDRLQRIRRR